MKGGKEEQDWRNGPEVSTGKLDGKEWEGVGKGKERGRAEIEGRRKGK